jgi:transposase-like protein
MTSPEGWVEQGMRFVWVDGKKRPLHRVIVEEKVGRSLRSDEIVRHRDRDLFNNNPGNLIVVSREEHFRLSMASEARVPWTEEEKDDAVRLYCGGLTIDEVARAVDRSYSATRRLLARWSVLRTPRATRALLAEHAARQSAEKSGSDPSGQQQLPSGLRSAGVSPEAQGGECFTLEPQDASTRVDK